MQSAPSLFDRAILVVDDYPLVAATLKGLLKAEGFETVDVAFGGVQALEKVADRAYALVISDLKMPGMTGVELLHALRAGGHHDVRFLMVTAYKDAGLATLEDGDVDAILVKPFGPERLRDTIKEIFGERLPDMHLARGSVEG